MSIFSRRRSHATEDGPGEPTLEEIEGNPELLAAEAAVNALPPPPSSMTSILGVAGTGHQTQTFVGLGAEDAGAELEDAPYDQVGDDPEGETGAR